MNSVIVMRWVGSVFRRLRISCLTGRVCAGLGVSRSQGGSLHAATQASGPKMRAHASHPLHATDLTLVKPFSKTLSSKEAKLLHHREVTHDVPRLPPAFTALLDTGLTPKGDLSPGTSYHGDRVYLPPTLRTIRGWETHTGPFGFASSCQVRWPGRGWSRRGDTHTACTRRGSRKSTCHPKNLPSSAWGAQGSARSRSSATGKGSALPASR